MISTSNQSQLEMCRITGNDLILSHFIGWPEMLLFLKGHIQDPWLVLRQNAIKLQAVSLKHFPKHGLFPQTTLG